MTSYEPELEQQRRTQQQAPQQAPDQDSTQRLASAMGNQAFGALARQGAGIMPDGRAHPDVESAIASTRGTGQKLDEGSRDKIGGALGDPLHDVHVHTDPAANQLASSVSARAFTTGNDVYFAKDEYKPGLERRPGADRARADARRPAARRLDQRPAHRLAAGRCPRERGGGGGR